MSTPLLKEAAFRGLSILMWTGCPGQCFPKSWEVNGTDIYVSDPAIHETYLDIDPVTGT